MVQNQEPITVISAQVAKYKGIFFYHPQNILGLCPSRNVMLKLGGSSLVYAGM